jgi:hypothetical protein
MCQKSAAEAVLLKQHYEQYKHKLQLQQEQQCKQRHSHESQEEEEDLQNSRREEEAREEEPMQQRQRAPVHGPHRLRFTANAANVQAVEREEKEPPVSSPSRVPHLPSSGLSCAGPSTKDQSLCTHPHSHTLSRRSNRVRDRVTRGRFYWNR